MWTNDEIQLRIDVVVKWLQQKSEEAQTKGLVCGISGGVDSAVVAALCKKAFPHSSLGVIMPCQSNPIDREDALLVASVLGIDVIEVELDDAHNVVYEKVETSLNAKNYPESSRKLGQGNLKARLRMATLYTVANLKNYLVVGTDNAAESYTGYFTKYGDGGVDLLPISSLTKTEVRSWAKALGLPDSIVTRIPTAGLWQGQTDEKEMGLTYDMIDRYLSGGDIPENAVARIEHLHRISEHKRQMPPSIELPKHERLD